MTKKLPYHPLRDSLTKEDWNRIQKVIDRELDITLATLDEIEAANDVFYDAIAGSKQTHYGVTTTQ